MDKVEHLRMRNSKTGEVHLTEGSIAVAIAGEGLVATKTINKPRCSHYVCKPSIYRDEPSGKASCVCLRLRQQMSSPSNNKPSNPSAETPSAQVSTGANGIGMMNEEERRRQDQQERDLEQVG
jgi:hypothetical protein